jgi:hypothetical protein
MVLKNAGACRKPPLFEIQEGDINNKRREKERFDEKAEST